MQHCPPTRRTFELADKVAIEGRSVSLRGCFRSGVTQSLRSRAISTALARRTVITKSQGQTIHPSFSLRSDDAHFSTFEALNGFEKVVSPATRYLKRIAIRILTFRPLNRRIWYLGY